MLLRSISASDLSYTQNFLHSAISLISHKNIQIFWLLHNQITEQHFMSYGVWRNLYSLNYQLNFILLSNSTFYYSISTQYGLTKPLLPTYNTHFLSSIPFLKCFFSCPLLPFLTTACYKVCNSNVTWPQNVLCKIELLSNFCT